MRQWQGCQPVAGCGGGGCGPGEMRLRWPTEGGVLVTSSLTLASVLSCMLSLTVRIHR